MLLIEGSDHNSSGLDSDGEGETTKTHDLYSKLMKHPDFLWTMQPRLYDAPEDSEEQDQRQIDEDLKLSANLHAGSFVANSAYIS